VGKAEAIGKFYYCTGQIMELMLNLEIYFPNGRRECGGRLQRFIRH
jgi:hypothetical protein